MPFSATVVNIVWCDTVCCDSCPNINKLQALVYDISFLQPFEEGAGKRCWEFAVLKASSSCTRCQGGVAFWTLLVLRRLTGILGCCMPSQKCLTIEFWLHFDRRVIRGTFACYLWIFSVLCLRIHGMYPGFCEVKLWFYTWSVRFDLLVSRCWIAMHVFIYFLSDKSFMWS